MFILVPVQDVGARLESSYFCWDPAGSKGLPRESGGVDVGGQAGEDFFVM